MGIHRGAIQLQVTVPAVGASEVDARSFTDHLPEPGTDLAGTLAGLDVHNFPLGSNLNFLTARCVRDKKICNFYPLLLGAAGGRGRARGWSREVLTARQL